MKMPSLSFFKKRMERFSFGGMLFFWYRHYKVPFFFGAFVVLAIGSWNWYYGLYRYHLSDEEKRQYVEQYFKETTFQEAAFRDAVDAFALRARMHEETLKVKRDIFVGKGIREKK